MRGHDECIRAADWCEHHATAAKSGTLRSVFNKIAAAWRKLALAPETRSLHFIALMELGIAPFRPIVSRGSERRLQLEVTKTRR